MIVGKWSDRPAIKLTWAAFWAYYAECRVAFKIAYCVPMTQKEMFEEDIRQQKLREKT